MKALTDATLPTAEKLPFLRAICWQTADVSHFTPEQALDRYERGWAYLGVLEELGPEERLYLRGLAKQFGSWLDGEV